MKKLEIKPGDKYGRLSIVSENKKKNGKRYFMCICNCGNVKNIRLSHMTSGNTTSCGCYCKEQAFKYAISHGFSGKKIYSVWSHIKKRCYDENHISYKNYGGRGITYDTKWEKFEGFYEDMGKTYKEGLQIDRIDNNGNYCKSNCRWITPKENSRNKRNNIIYKGKCISERVEYFGVTKEYINNRRKRYNIYDIINNLKNKIGKQ